MGRGWVQNVIFIKWRNMFPKSFHLLAFFTKFNSSRIIDPKDQLLISHKSYTYFLYTKIEFLRRVCTPGQKLYIDGKRLPWFLKRARGFLSQTYNFSARVAISGQNGHISLFLPTLFRISEKHVFRDLRGVEL